MIALLETSLVPDVLGIVQLFCQHISPFPTLSCAIFLNWAEDVKMNWAKDFFINLVRSRCVQDLSLNNCTAQKL